MSNTPPPSYDNVITEQPRHSSTTETTKTEDTKIDSHNDSHNETNINCTVTCCTPDCKKDK